MLLVNRALLRSQRGRLDEAAGDFHDAIQLNERQYEAYAGLGAVFQRQKKWVEAIEQFTEAIRLRPGWSPLYRGRAEAYLKGDNSSPDVSAALRDLDDAIRYDKPGDPLLAIDHKRRGEVLRNLQRFEDALEACDAALRVTPGYNEAHRLRAQLLVHMKRYDEVIRACNSALAGGSRGPTSARSAARPGPPAGTIRVPSMTIPTRSGSNRAGSRS